MSNLKHNRQIGYMDGVRDADHYTWNLDHKRAKEKYGIEFGSQEWTDYCEGYMEGHRRGGAG